MTAGSRLVAQYPDADKARSAILELERRGLVDAERVELEGFADPAAESTRRAADRRAGRTASRGAVAGVAIGTAAGAVLAGGITLALGVDPQPAAPLGAFLGGGAFGGAMGFFYGLGSRLPVTDDAVAAVDRGNGRPVALVVSIDQQDDADAIRSHLEHGATRVESR